MQNLLLLIFLISLSYLLSRPALSDDHFALTLQEAENFGVQNSDEIKSQENITEASLKNARVGKAYLYPRLSIEGYYFNNSVLPNPPIANGAFTFGAHNNYGIGPQLSYTLFDGGRLRKNHDSLLALSDSKRNDEKSRRKLVLYQTRNAYFQLQFAIQSLKFTAASLRLAEDQGKDISTKFKIGSASKLDNVSARKNILEYRLKFEDARKNLSIATREMLMIIRKEGAYDTFFPLPEDMVHVFPKDYGTPTMILKVDQLEQTLQTLTQFGELPRPGNHPELESLEQLHHSAQLTADSFHSGFYPVLSVYVKSIFQYPNVVVKEEIWQNTFGANLSLPLFEGDLTRNQTQKAKSEAMAYDYQKKQKQIEFDRDWNKFHDNVKNLLAQVKIARMERDATHEIRQLTYQSYQNGRSRYLDVQDANLRELQSMLKVADIESQILYQYSGLDYISGK